MSFNEHETKEKQVKPEEEANNNLAPLLSSLELTPWMNEYIDFHMTNMLIAIHNKIVNFFKLMESHPEEMKELDIVVEHFKDMAIKTFGFDQVCCHLGIFLPDFCDWFCEFDITFLCAV